MVTIEVVVMALARRVGTTILTDAELEAAAAALRTHTVHISSIDAAGTYCPRAEDRVGVRLEIQTHADAERSYQEAFAIARAVGPASGDNVLYAERGREQVVDELDRPKPRSS